MSDQTLYAIDQHILAGGKAMIFVDPNADTAVAQGPFGGVFGADQSSDLGPLLAAWGVSYDKEQFLADAELALRVVVDPSRQPVSHLGMIGVQRAGLNTEDIITSGLETINLSSAGSIAQLEGASTNFEPLIQSTESSMLMSASLVRALTDPSILVDEFVASGERQIIAARITGPVRSAFPNGRPMVAVEQQDIDEDLDLDLDSDSDSENIDVDTADVNENSELSANDDAVRTEIDSDVEEPEPQAVPHLLESVQDINVIVVADTDILSDRLWVQVGSFLGQRISQAFANNGDMVVNSLDNLLGSADLVSIRSRGRYSRPFTRVLELQRHADERLRLEETQLLRSLEETGEALVALNQTPEGQPITELSAEQQAEIEKFNQVQLETRRRLRDVRYQLNRDIELLGSTLKLANTVLVPVILTLLMLFFGISRSRKRRVRF